jgi:hypothetical protein
MLRVVRARAARMRSRDRMAAGAAGTLLLVVAIVVGLASRPASNRGLRTVAPPVITTSPAPLEAADSRFPAAGVCGQASGDNGTVQVGTKDGVAIPRCLILRGDQRLSVTNVSDRPLNVTLGSSYSATVGPGETHMFDTPVGNHLAPGVHQLHAATTSSDIWVDPVCGPRGEPPCHTP